MSMSDTVYDKRNYRVRSVSSAKKIAAGYIETLELANATRFGLPEVDDRYHLWRVPIRTRDNIKIGEVVIDAYTSLIIKKKTTSKSVLETQNIGSEW